MGKQLRHFSRIGIVSVGHEYQITEPASKTQFKIGTIFSVRCIVKDEDNNIFYATTESGDEIPIYFQTRDNSLEVINGIKYIAKNSKSSEEVKEMKSFGLYEAGESCFLKEKTTVYGDGYNMVFNPGHEIQIESIIVYDGDYFIREKRGGHHIPLSKTAPVSKDRQKNKKSKNKKQRFCFALRDSNEDLIGYKSGLLLEIGDNPKHYVDRLDDSGALNIYEPFDDLIKALAEGDYEKDTMLDHMEKSLFSIIENRIPDKKVNDVFPLKITIDFPQKRNRFIKKGRVKWEISMSGKKTLK